MAKLIEINKKLYSVGIEWRTRTKVQQGNYDKLKKEALESKFDTYVSRKSQVGFCNTDKNEKFLKSKSLASSIASSIPDGSIVGIFHLTSIHFEQFYYLIAIKNNIILGLGDNVYLTKEEANTNLKQILGLSHIIGSEQVEFDSHEESIEYLASFLQKKNVKFILNEKRLKPFFTPKKTNRKLIYLGIFGLCLLSLFYAFSKYLAYQETRSLEDANLLFLQDLEKRTDDLRLNPENLFEQRWKDKPLPTESFIACQEKLFAIPLVADGWELTNTYCQNNAQVFANWSWKEEFPTNFINLPFGGTFDNSTQVVLSKFPIKQDEFMTNQVAFDKLLTGIEVLKIMNQLAQNIGGMHVEKFQFTEPESKKYKELELVLYAPWQKGQFHWQKIPDTLLVNNSLFEAFDAIPSLYITEIIFNASSKLWSIKGEFYVSM